MSNWKEKLNQIEVDAEQQVKSLLSEIADIYETFPRLRPKRKGTGIKRLYHGRHWTQQPENREKAMANLRKAIAARHP
jgi:hypothetical protein